MSEQPASPANLRDGPVGTDEVALHCCDAAHVPIELGSQLRTHAAPAPRIMLVEDDFVLRANLAELLMQEGYAVTCAADGTEALRRLQTEPAPSVILMDIVLPRLDGVGFRRVQLATWELRDIPTIALTSLPDAGGDEESAFTDVLRKPVDVDHLIEVVARFCPRA